MDLTELIIEKRAEFAAVRDPTGIDAVLRHLGVAEKHFQRGRSSGETDLFTDVIYRTNQVFEGVLKELFLALTEEEIDGVTPYKIESYLERHEIFSSRVIDYFKRYRQDWRNKSTHDYQLDFDEQEAFLAISTVASFCYVSIDQMIQGLAASTVAKTFQGSQLLDLSDTDKFASLIAENIVDLYQTISGGTVHYAVVSEVAMLGAIEGFIKSLIKDIQISVEPSVAFDGTHFRPDMVLNDGDRIVVIELKRISDSKRRGVVYKRLRQQLRTYSKATKSEGAIGIMLPADLRMVTDKKFVVSRDEDIEFNSMIVHPEHFEN